MLFWKVTLNTMAFLCQYEAWQFFPSIHWLGVAALDNVMLMGHDEKPALILIRATKALICHTNATFHARSF